MSDSIWTKEISFSRKPKPAHAQPASAEPAAEPTTPWWKQEVTLPRRNRAHEIEQLTREAVAASFAAPAPPPAHVAAAPPAPPPVAEPVAFEPLASAPVVPESVGAEADADQEQERWLAGPELPPFPELEPEPSAAAEAGVAAEPAPEAAVMLHPPVRELEAPPVAAAETPFWKREVSLSRKPKAPKELKRTQKAPKPKPQKQPQPQARTRARRALRLPAPRFAVAGRGHSVVGLKIGASQLAAARISNDTVAELQQVARTPLASGIVVGGELRDPEALAAALRSFFSAHRLPRKGVRLGIATSRIGVRIFELAGIDDERQLGNAVRFRAQEVLPVPLDEAVLDFRVLGESVDDEGRVVKRVLLVVAQRELVDRYVSACRKAGIVLGGIDLEAFALLRSLAPPAERDGSALVAVSIGHERTTLAVSDGRVCEFTRVLEWGGWALNVALARALDSTPAEVEPLKRRLSLDGGRTPEPLTPEQASVAVEALRRGVESLARELVSSLQFYQGQPGSLGIGEIVITGGSAQMAGLAAALERVVGVRVRVGNPLNRIRVSKQVAEPDIGSLAVAIGLGIED